MKIENADITWLESGLPYSTRFQDIYYSREDELAESQHVFLEANSLSKRWGDSADHDAFHLGELGFGSGLNFLQSMKLWSELSIRPSRLHYIAFEKYPLTIDSMKRIHQHWPTLAQQSAELLEQYTDHGEGCHRLKLSSGITLDIYYGDALEQLNQRWLDASPPIQCWFLDGFSPANNSQLWEESLMHSLANCSDESTTLSTYSVAGKVRNALKNAGFEVSKIEGFGRKRHSLFATRSESYNSRATEERAQPSATPWFTQPQPRFTGKDALVIGAGLAGCSTAYSLAQRDWKVTVVDIGNGPASAASGTSKLALRCRLFNTASSEAQFFLHAYLFALRQFTQLHTQRKIDWEPCGVLQLKNAMNKRSPLQLEKLRQLYSSQVVEELKQIDASREAGLAIQGDSWFFPTGGAMTPSSLCAAYLAHDNIDALFNAHASGLERSNDKWKVNFVGVQEIKADVVVLANSHGAQYFEQCSELPLQVLRGQTTEIAASNASQKIARIVSGGRTIFPASAGRHLLSASYANSSELKSQRTDAEENIKLAAGNFDQADALSNEALQERVSLRCNSPDRMPLVGLAPDSVKMRSTYAALSMNAKAKFDVPGNYYEGLYLNIAHGSNGLASCPLSAEFLASQIERENLPLSQGMAAGLSPTRFLIKDLKKQR